MKYLEDYLKLLKENGFTYKLKNDLYEISKYGETVTLIWVDFDNDLIDYCEYMTNFKDLDYNKVERYAYSLLHYNIKKTYKQAYKESLRWYKKEYQGFVEPLPCNYIDDKLFNRYKREKKLKRILK